jgi:hypothetical protein
MFNDERYTLMALADIYQLTDFQRLPSGEEVQNVYFYQRGSSAGTAADLEQEWESTVRAAVLGVQSNVFVHFLTRVVSLGNVADFNENSDAGIVGLREAGVRNEWDAFSYTLRPETRAVRPGHKRIGGVPEGDSLYTNGVVTDSSMLILMHAVRTAFATVLSSDDDEYTPVIVKRQLVGGNYRLPITDEELVAVPIVIALLNNKITHQTSRGNSR